MFFLFLDDVAYLRFSAFVRLRQFLLDSHLDERAIPFSGREEIFRRGSLWLVEFDFEFCVWHFEVLSVFVVL